MMGEVSLEQLKAKELLQEKQAIITPLIQSLNLKKEEVNALLALDKKRLKNIAKKLDIVLHTHKHSTKIRDPQVPAKLLWSIARNASPKGDKVIPGKIYVAKLTGTMVLACYSVASSLYNVDREPEEKKP